MAKRRKQITIEDIIKKIELMGGREIADEDRKQPWYKEHVKQLERWRKEEVGMPFTAKEKHYFYGSSKMKAKA